MAGTAELPRTGRHRRRGLDLDRRPILVFWESTRACALACRHCRADAVHEPLSGELTTDEAERLVDSLAGFGAPHPILVATGGNVLERRDLDRLLARARSLGIQVALAPSVTPLLTDERVGELRRAGVKVMSISLDGARPETHDAIRSVEGHFEATLDALRMLRRHGVTVQVNTTVMRDNVEQLPRIARIVRDVGAAIWEVFFLVRTGRGTALQELDPGENEDVSHFLVDASQYGFLVRTVEGPWWRRVAAERLDGWPPEGRTGLLYERLFAALRFELGEPTFAPRAQTRATRDGRGILFVAHDGEIYPSGFLPVSLGNVRDDSLVDVYRDHPVLRRLRAADFPGRCGHCGYGELCGGSRARAYAATGDPFADDPACPFHLR
jgi:AdoMet-dependent heme synthase